MTEGDRIKKIREVFDITSNDFAEIVGIHPVTIRKYETNKMKPSKEHIDKMCEALKLPRMIFEGIPEQYTDYQYSGDFFQQLFMMLATNTLSLKGKYKDDTSNENGFFSLNPALSNYIVMKQNGNVIPIEDIQIEFSLSRFKNSTNDELPWFQMWIQFLQLADNAMNSSKWNAEKKGETKDEYVDRLAERSDEVQLKLMLSQHSWHQYMKGIGSTEEAHAAIQQVIDAGGTYYDYVNGLDAPETVKDHLIDEYERLKIIEILELPSYSYEPGKEFDYDKYIEFKEEQDKVIAKYKKEHPEGFR